MVGRPASRLYAVMAGCTARDNAVMTELSWHPAEIGMAISTAVVYGNMIRRFARSLHIVVTINACAENLGVVDTRYILP